MRERLRGKASRILDNADALIAEGREAIPEVKDPLVELIRQLRSEGVILSAEVGWGTGAAKEIPIKLRLKPANPKEK
jgi:hypothetical protein